MIFSLLYVILALFGLGLLVFIHELGHYWMARRVGMTVEAFSIGFGKPIYVWENDGVKWQICYLPFGGFVRIAGMEKKGILEPYQIPDGFYGKRPAQRIKVALMGPIVNIAFALLAFCILWSFGGREKPFSEFTHLVGWVDTSSDLHQAGVRPGDLVQELDHHSFTNYQDVLYSAVFNDKPPQISGSEIDYFKDEKTPFDFQFSIPKGSSLIDRIMTISGTFRPASYLIYNAPDSLSLDKETPMKDSGIDNGDRILWVDGKLIFSKEELIQTINQPKALLTIERNGQIFLSRVPRLKVSDLRITPNQKSELQDWQHEAKISGRLYDLFFIPYTLSPDCLIETPLTYLNADTEEQLPMAEARSPLEIPLEAGDRVLAVDGLSVLSSYEMMNLLQERHIQIIVKKEPKTSPVSWKNADRAFIADIPFDSMQAMIQSIGTDEPIQERDNLKLLKPAVPRPMSQLAISEEARARYAKADEAQQKAIDEIKDPEMREQAQAMFDESRNQVKLGIAMNDRAVNYNPSPFILFGNVFKDTWRTLIGLFSGNLSPKYMQGPVGIITIMQESWGYGFKEALYWLGMISLNLGILNLLPVPVLDGGHICFSLWEIITGKPIKSKTMERLIIPFVVLLVALFIYLTYHDIMRIVSGFFH